MRFWTLPALLLLLAAGACDSGPEGPGDVEAVVRAPAPTGALVLDVTGQGIQGFSGAGQTRVVHAPVGADGRQHRVILVTPVGGDLRFRVRLEDRGGPLPTVQIVDAVDLENRSIPAAGYDVRFDR